MGWINPEEEVGPLGLLQNWGAAFPLWWAYPPLLLLLLLMYVEEAGPPPGPLIVAKQP